MIKFSSKLRIGERLGLGFGLDVDDLALRLPGVGKLPGPL